MDILEIRLAKALSALARETYKPKKMERFELVIRNEGEPPFRDEYKMAERRICINGILREPGHLFMACIQQLAHHCQCTVYMAPAPFNDVVYYKAYYELLTTAVRMGMVSRDDANRGMPDNPPSTKVIRLHGRIEEGQKKESLYKPGARLAHTRAGRDARNAVIEMGFAYNQRARDWEKEVAKEDEESARKALQEAGLDARFTGILDVTASALVIVSGNTYLYKDQLLKRKYRYNPSRGNWSKLITTASAMMDEKEFLGQINTPGSRIAATIRY